MVISDKHKYLFVELPHTGSTAISKELCENYDGVTILSKHARYNQFLKIATPERRRYFVFSCMRNPLDEAVSVYFRYKTNHKGRYTNPAKWKRNGGSVSDYSLKAFNFVHRNSADFPAFLKRFYRKPYDDWSNLAHKKFDFIIRFENLQGDFSKVLDLLGIKLVRPLTVVNKTAEKGVNFWFYYPPEIFDYARKIFGPFMKEWNYDFPSEWGEKPIPLLSQVEFRLLRILRRVCWRIFGEFLLD